MNLSFNYISMSLGLVIIMGLLALLHLYIMWFEMFAWETKGRKVFRNFPKELFSQTKVMAGNQGLYNGFLAAGFIWYFFITEIEWRDQVAWFFLLCVLAAGIYGSLTASKKIFFVQALPAAIGIIFLILK